MGDEMKLLTTDEAAQMLRVHPETIRRWARAGRIQHVWFNGKRAFEPSSISDIERPKLGRPFKRADNDGAL